MTQIETARRKKISPEVRKISQREAIDRSRLCKLLATGKVVIPFNKIHSPRRMCGIGQDLKVKVNANIGTSPDRVNLSLESKKMKCAIASGADTIMDLSIGGNLKRIRKTLLENCSLPLGTVPIYEAALDAQNKYGSITKIKEKEIFNILRQQAEDGVDFFTVHCGITQDAMKLLGQSRRVTGVVSRGGAILSRWMKANKRENPLYEHFDELIDIAKSYDIVLSLGDALRPGSLADATDAVQIHELLTLGELAAIARRSGVQVMIEGPGHLPLDQIAANVSLEKTICAGAPFYVLGPIVTDVACGHDHITSAIGGAIAAFYGADFLCYVTPSEHLNLPDVEDVKNGVIATRIAAHSADIARGIKGAADWDRAMSRARRMRDWKKQLQLSLSHQKTKAKQSQLSSRDVCTMCGEFCSMKLNETRAL